LGTNAYEREGGRGKKRRKKGKGKGGRCFYRILLFSHTALIGTEEARNGKKGEGGGREKKKRRGEKGRGDFLLHGD